MYRRKCSRNNLQNQPSPGIDSMLAWTVYISFLGAAALLLLDPANQKAARTIALLTATAGLFIVLAGVVQYQAGSGIVTVWDRPWIPSLGIRYHLAADGFSLTLLLLTGIAAVGGILFSWNVGARGKEFFAVCMWVIGGGC